MNSFQVELRALIEKWRKSGEGPESIWDALQEEADAIEETSDFTR
jgi:hypothetical protein